MRVVVVAIVILLAGCSQPSQDTFDIDPDAVQPIEPDPHLDLALGDLCWAGLGLSIYPRDQYMASVGLPGNMTPLDLRGLIGDPKVVSANGAGWLRADGPITGHWHAASICPGADARWGFVGIAIDPPDFDPQPADLNLLTVVWSWDSDHVDQIAQWGHATTGQAHVETGTVTSLLLEDEHHGVYEGRFATPINIAPHIQSIRFWLLLPTAGMHNHHDQTGPFTPVSYDLHTRDIDAWGSGDTVGAFVHSGTDHHAPLPALGGNAYGMFWTMQDVRLADGPRPDVLFETTWVH